MEFGATSEYSLAGFDRQEHFSQCSVLSESFLQSVNRFCLNCDGLFIKKCQGLTTALNRAERHRVSRGLIVGLNSSCSEIPAVPAQEDQHQAQPRPLPPEVTQPHLLEGRPR